MRIEINAFDTLFFRDGKPFTMGEESWAEGIFPPPPSVIYGALRAAYFAHHPEDLSKAGKEGEDPTRNLKITDIALTFSNKRNFFYPVPADCAVKENKTDEDEDDEKYELYRMKKKNDAYSSKSFSPLCADSKIDKLESASGFYLSDSALSRYLNMIDNADQEDKPMNIYKNWVEKLSDHISVEPKIGIRRDRSTKTSEDGKLYRLGMRRLNDVSFLIELELEDNSSQEKGGGEQNPPLRLEDLLPEKGIIRLGGEGKTAYYEPPVESWLLKSDPLSSENDVDKKGKSFVLYFKTPVLFEKYGYYPDFPDKYRIVSMAMDKPLSIGGWDMKAKAPKPMKKFVPAGAVYIVESDSDVSLGDFKKVCENLCSEEYKKQGYGLYYVGVYNGKD